MIGEGAMNCRQIRSRFADLLDGHLRPNLRRTVQEHLAKCPECRDEFEELEGFLANCDEFLVCPGPAYSFETLRARMATIEPLQEVIAFLPKLRVEGAIPRLAVGFLVMLMVCGTPGTFRNTRGLCDAVRDPFRTRVAQWENQFALLDLDADMVQARSNGRPGEEA